MEAFIARTIQIFLALAGAYLVALWFVLVIWTYRDIESRSRNVVTQIVSTLLVVLFWVPGVLLYLILRPKETLDAAYQRSLEEEYLLQDLEELPLCPACERYVEDDFVLCPHCHTRLREPCLACERLIDLRWSICAYCGAAQGGEAAGKPERVDEPAARWRAPLRLGRRATEPVAAADVEPTPAEPGDETMAEGEEAEGERLAGDAGGAAEPPAAEPARPVAVAAEAQPVPEPAREPIPLVPVPRGRFRRVDGEPAAARNGGPPLPGEDRVAAPGPFTAILGSRNHENGRVGPGALRARRLARQNENGSVPHANGTRPDTGHNPPRPVLPSADADEPVVDEARPEGEAVAAHAEGKGD